MAADYSRSLRYIRDATSRIDKDYKSEPTPRGCTPLSLAQAREARRLFLAGARRIGERITAKVVQLPAV